VKTLLRHGHAIDAASAGPLIDGDSLVLRDTAEGLHQIADTFSIGLIDRKYFGADRESAKIATHFAELVLGSDAAIVGRSLRDTRFAETHEVAVVGLSRGTEGLLHVATPVADQRLSPGDVLLVQGTAERIEQLRRIRGMLLLEASRPLPRSPKAKVAMAILFLVILAASTGALPIHVAAFVGVVAMLLTKCIGLEGIGRALSLEVVLLLAASLALGQALITTGAAAWIASGAVALVRDASPPIQIASFIALAALFTNFVSNSAAAAIGTPVAIASAVQLQLPLEPFVLAVLYGANLSYATPMAYQTNLMIMKAGGYRFSDFVRVGAPLVVIMLVTLSILLSRRYGL
jgi:di/tricarboxylate transporter